MKFWTLFLVFAAVVIFLFLGLRRGDSRFLWLTGLSLLAVLGALYYTADDMKFRRSINVPFGGKTTFSGVIVSNPVLKTASQEFKLKLNLPFSGNILIKTARYPEFRYGDEVNIEGKIEKPFAGSYARYLSKERISGVVTFAEVEKIGSGRKSKIKTSLFEIKNAVIGSFQRVLPAKEAAFVSGLTLGERGEFSADFKEAMAKSGTTHLVALSGYNITIIIKSLAILFIWFLSRRFSFVLTVLVIVGFVLMTGAEASVVRAAIMGILAMLAGEVGRLFDFRNAIILAGFLMVLQNPKVLVFDIGFQLSFLALVGIIYLRPAIVRFLKIGEDKGFLSWKENLLTTASAQLMVAPLLISSFGSFSLISLAANVLVLELIPITMFLGFLTAFLGLFIDSLTTILALALSVFLKFEMLVIELFAKISVPIGAGASWLFIIFYYAALVIFIFYVGKVSRT
ncbi:MAG TPA: ComEC/Rec2 family competence protein [Candidatus Paceibacterota bacterium]|nr:ComEC/Rec2 family competence protein [Candidatus Paceibacterota bacterium]